ncbi:hypothetical protein BJX64DRAFT_158881 [Aspergillus heterothallicus]
MRKMSRGVGLGRRSHGRGRCLVPRKRNASVDFAPRLGMISLRNGDSESYKFEGHSRRSKGGGHTSHMHRHPYHPSLARTGSQPQMCKAGKRPAARRHPSQQYPIQSARRATPRFHLAIPFSILFSSQNLSNSTIHRGQFLFCSAPIPLSSAGAGLRLILRIRPSFLCLFQEEKSFAVFA